MAGTAFAGGEFKIYDQTKMEIGSWGQGWYQFVEDGKPGGNLNELMVRRAYLYVKGQVDLSARSTDKQRARTKSGTTHKPIDTLVSPIIPQISLMERCMLS